MTTIPSAPRRAIPALLPSALALAALAVAALAVPLPTAGAQSPTLPAIIPTPASMTATNGGRFRVDSGTAIVMDTEAPAEVEEVASYLVELLRPATRPARRLARGERAPRGSIHLTLAGADTALGPEGYTLNSATAGVVIAATAPAGLFHGVQTLRQLLPVSVEHAATINRGLGVPSVRIADSPRFTWRGSMLDVSRHFLPLDAVKKHVDMMALYKMNRLHLHLADDQGWRIEIRSRPELARVGGSTQVGGGPGGYYTQEQYADLVDYAARRHVTIVPEIDMPGHTNAALASIPALNCDGRSPPLYTGIKVGFSTLCVTSESTYAVVEDVIRELAALTPGPYLHVGGDEVEKLTRAQYVRFVERVEKIVRSHGKRMIGWGEIAQASLDPSTVVQHWKRDSARVHVARGGQVVLSPSSLVYLDMKYDSTTVLGFKWAGYIDLRKNYEWDPAKLLAGVPESAILGVEAPLWAETLVRPSDYQYMAFPRLISVAEIGWSRQAARSWANFRTRLGAHGERLTALGVNFFRSPQVDWGSSRGAAAWQP